MIQLYANNAKSSLASSISALVTTITVATGDGVKFPTPTGSDYFLATIVSAAINEIVKCTSRTGDVLTVVRGQEGTTTESWSSGTTIEMRVTRDTLTNHETFIYNVQQPTGSSLIGSIQSGTGAVTRTVQAKECERFTFEDYGAVGDGVSDDTTAVQKAITAVTYSSYYWGKVEGSKGKTYKLTGSINFQQLQQGIFDGNGCTFNWQGNNTDPMFLVEDVAQSTFRNFKVTASTTKQLAAVFQSQNGASANVTPTKNRYENIVIEGTNGGVTKGWLFSGSGGGGDNNNDQNLFINCQVNNYTTAAWSFEHIQSKAHLLMHCGFAGNSTGLRGIATSLGGGTVGGSFVAVHCFGGGNQTADFDIGDSNDYVHLFGGNFENSARLLQTTGASGAAFPIIIEGVRWGINSSNIAANKRVVVMQFKGPLTMIGNQFEPATAGQALEIYFGPGGNYGGFTAIGNHFGSTLTNPFQSGFNPNVAFGNTINRNDGNNVVMLGEPFQTLTVNSATPNLFAGRMFKTANSNPTTITSFLTPPGPGTIITILFTDANTTIADSAPFKLTGAFVSTADDTMQLLWDGTSWYEISRSVN